MKKDKTHKNKAGFSIPKDYFESFENELSKKWSYDTAESENNSSQLQHLNVDAGFEIPKNYFDQLEDQILSKTSSDISKEKGKGKVIDLKVTKRSLVYFSGIAAMIAIIFSLFTDKKTTSNFNDIALTDLYEYLTEENIDLSDEDIFSLFATDISYSEAFDIVTTTDEELFEYLSEEEVEYTLENEILFTE